MRKLLPIIPLLFWVFPAFVFGQDYRIDVKSYTIQEGLSHRNVNFVLQDQRGLMWFGTEYGLNRFDGYNFKWFTKEKHGLQTNRISNGLMDRDGLFWLLHNTTKPFTRGSKIFNEIDIFDPVSGQVQAFEAFTEGKTDLKAADIVGFAQKGTEDVIFLTKQNKLYFHKGSGVFWAVSLKKNYRKIEDFHWSSNGYLWFNAQKSTVENSPQYVIAVNEKGEEISAVPLEAPYHFTVFYDDYNSINEKWINTIAYEENRGFQFLEVNADGQVIFNPDEVDYSELGLDFSTCHRYFLYADNADFACFLLQDKFYVFEKASKKLHNLSEEYEYLNLSNDVYFDYSGKIWVATQFGIYQIRLRKNQFTKVMVEEDGLRGIRALKLDKNNRLWSIVQGKKNLWMIQLANDRKTVLNTESVNNSDNPNRLPFPNMQMYALEVSKTGDIYYQSSHHVATLVNTDNFQTQDFAPLDKSELYPWSYFEDSKGNLWAGYSLGTIGLFNLDSSELITVSKDKNLPFISYQFIETKDFFWLITEAGLFQFDPKIRQTTARYWSGGTGKFKLPFDNLRHAFLEKDSVTFWFGTGGAGLIKFNTETGDYQQFTKADGLSNNVIYAVYPDDFGNLWLTSDYGIMRFNKISRQVNTYLTNDGISHNEFNRTSHLQTDEGTLFFGSLNGITMFHPNDFQTDTTNFNPPLVINQFQQFVGDENNLTDKTAELLSNQTITLEPNDPFFRMEFSLLTYEDSDKIQYAYQVEGQDPDWNYQKENYIRLSRLPYGNHTLRIKAQASNGQWSPNELNLNVIALKPFYLETWFLISAVLLLIASVVLFFKYRTAQLQRQKAELEEEVKKRTKTISEQAEELKSLEKLKSRFFANVSHELRTPLTLMLGPINKLEKGDLPKEKAGRLISFLKNNSIHLLKLVNEILDLSKLETNRLEIKETDVHFYDFLQPLVAQFKSSGDSESLKLLFEYHANKSLHIALDIGKFEKIVHNFLSNAIKFTPFNGTVKLIVEEKETQLLIKVSDTGTGIHPNDLPHIFDRFYQSKQPDAPVQGGTGIGLSLCKELAELLDGRVWAESEWGVGSVFYFEFPKKETVDGRRLTVDGSALATPKGEHLPTVSKAEATPFEAASSGSPLGVRGNAGISATPNSQPATVLIVEDNPELREYLTVLLSDEYNIVTAENGKKAWDFLTADGENNPPNRPPLTACRLPSLIISDLMMPVMDGFQFLEKVKSHDAFRHIPVIMLTARADVRVKLRALRIGVDDYLTKPFVEEELKIRMRNLLNNYKERVSAHSAENKQNGKSKKPVIAEADMKWLEEVETIYLDFINDSRLNLEFVAAKLFLSTRQLNRRLKQLTGLSPNQYLREIRLTKARDYIEIGKFKSIKETCHAVGFSDVKYFNKIFRERFGMSPSKTFL